MELCRTGAGLMRRPPVEHAPAVEIIFGGDEGGPDVGLMRVTLPPGSGMPEHDHGGSDVVLIPQIGSIEVFSGGEIIEAGPGEALLIRKDERVTLTNPGERVAEVLVAVAPPTFLASIRAWPEAVSA